MDLEVPKEGAKAVVVDDDATITITNTRRKKLESVMVVSSFGIIALVLVDGWLLLIAIVY